MDVKLERGLRTALDERAVEIDRDNVLHCQRAAHGGPRVDVERAGVTPGAAVAVMIDESRALEHANRVNELLFHGETRLFQNSHERPTVPRLTASARRPSSGSSAAIGPPSIAAWSCTRALISVKIARKTAACRLGPTATNPCARRSSTAWRPSASASAAPLSALLMTMSVVPNLVRMSNTGTPDARNAAL